MDDTVTNKDINNNIIDSLPNNNNNILDTNRTATPMPTYPEEDIEFIDDEYANYGYNIHDLSVKMLKTWRLQSDFCAGLSKGGSILSGLKATAVSNGGKPISRRCYEYWCSVTEDKPFGHLNFRQKRTHAWEDFRDSLEDHLNEICVNLTPQNSPVALLARLNKEIPAYKQVMPDNSSQDLIAEVRKVFRLAARPDTRRIEGPDEPEVT